MPVVTLGFGAGLTHLLTAEPAAEEAARRDRGPTSFIYSPPPSCRRLRLSKSYGSKIAGLR
jgi:hypothetical protein